MQDMSDLRKSIADRLGSAAKSERPGAKAKFGNVDRLDSLIAAVYRALRNNDKEAAKRLMADAAKEIDSSTPAYIVSEYKDLKRSMSRPGAKAKMGGMKGFGDWAVSFTNITVERLPELRKLARDLKASIKVSSPSPNGYVSGTITRKYGSSEAPDLMASGKVKSMIQSLGGQLDSRLAGFSRPGAKAKMAKWESTLTKKDGKPMEEFTATIHGEQFKIEVKEQAGKPVATLYIFYESRGFRPMGQGTLQAMMNKAQRYAEQEAKDVDAIGRSVGFWSSRPGVKGSSKAKA
jgi:hypothetical protein